MPASIRKRLACTVVRRSSQVLTGPGLAQVAANLRAARPPGRRCRSCCAAGRRGFPAPGVPVTIALMRSRHLADGSAAMNSSGWAMVAVSSLRAAPIVFSGIQGQNAHILNPQNGRSHLHARRSTAIIRGRRNEVAIRNFQFPPVRQVHQERLEGGRFNQTAQSRSFHSLAIYKEISLVQGFWAATLHCCSVGAVRRCRAAGSTLHQIRPLPGVAAGQKILFAGLPELQTAGDLFHAFSNE